MRTQELQLVESKKIGFMALSTRLPGSQAPPGNPCLPGSARQLVVTRYDNWRQSLQVMHSQAQPGNEKCGMTSSSLPHTKTSF